MKKKNVLIRLVFVFSMILLGSVFEETKSQITIEDPIGPAARINYCRCHGSECYGGNHISFRSACAKSDEAINCRDWDSNCK